MSESELDELYRSFERAGVILTPADKAALKLEVWEIANTVQITWLAWERTPRQMEKEMRSVAELARLLEKALGKPPDGDWLEAEQTPIVRLPYDLSFVWSERYAARLTPFWKGPSAPSISCWTMLPLLPKEVWRAG
jgi:hypothetical protein